MLSPQLKPAKSTILLILSTPPICTQENLISFFLLAALYLYVKRRPLVWVFLACILAAWTKLTGLLILPVLVVDLTLRKQWRTAAIYTAATVFIVALLYTSFGW